MQQCLTFHITNQFAPGLAEEGQLTCNGLQHLDKVRQEKNDLYFVIGQVASAADALSSLDMRSTQ